MHACISHLTYAPALHQPSLAYMYRSSYIDTCRWCSFDSSPSFFLTSYNYSSNHRQTNEYHPRMGGHACPLPTAICMELRIPITTYCRCMYLTGLSDCFVR